jgi:hypothetical protein
MIVIASGRNMRGASNLFVQDIRAQRCLRYIAVVISLMRISVTQGLPSTSNRIIAIVNGYTESEQLSLSP